MNKILLDTDVVINLLKKENEFVSKFLYLHSKGVKLYYNPIVIAEVYAGAFDKELDMIESFFNQLTSVDICKYTGIQAGKYAKEYKKSHNKISLEDYIIASSCKVNSLTLWTNNKKHYPMSDIEKI